MKHASRAKYDCIMKKEKRRKIFDLRLSKYELLHLRDLFSILLPVSLKETVSQKLALSQERVLVEAMLWQKIAKICEEANIPLGEDAPDFIMSTVSTPEIGVFELATDLPGSDEQTSESSSIFDLESSEVEQDEEE